MVHRLGVQKFGTKNWTPTRFNSSPTKFIHVPFEENRLALPLLPRKSFRTLPLYYLSLLLKSFLHDKQFKSEIKTSSNILQMNPHNFWKKGITRLPKRWIWCIHFVSEKRKKLMGQPNIYKSFDFVKLNFPSVFHVFRIII